MPNLVCAAGCAAGTDRAEERDIKMLEFFFLAFVNFAALENCTSKCVTKAFVYTQRKAKIHSVFIEKKNCDLKNEVSYEASGPAMQTDYVPVLLHAPPPHSK